MREEKKTSVFVNGMVWFGAAVSIAEIMTGVLLAPLGLARGLAAIVLGHLIGCALLFCAGLIGARTGKSAMETTKMAFGQQGSLLFSSLNVLQLAGWTAVMIAGGAAAAARLAPFGGTWVWSLVIGAFVLAWLLLGVKNLSKLQAVAMGALLVLTAALSAVVFRGQAAPALGGLRFGAAVELSVAMPLSWLPLISDYTRSAKRPVAATAASAGVYFLASGWMYAIGLGAALFFGESDIAALMAKAGLGVAGVLIVLFSTVTTTFLDVYSAGVSAGSISRRLREKPFAAAVCVAGTAMAIWMPVTRFEDFLYLIGSVFAPMIAIQIVDYFVLRRDGSDRAFRWRNLAVWAVGFAVYRVFLTVNTPVGSTLPVMVITGALCWVADRVQAGVQQYARRKA